jgi:hypothetical protein
MALIISSRVSAKKYSGLSQLGFVRLQMKLAAVGRDDAAGIDHCGAGHQTLVDGAPETAAREIAFVADVTHRGKTGFQHRARVGHTLNGAKRIGVQQRGEVVVPVITLRIDRQTQMRVCIE